jgi:hydrogenase assembly chaperone HypC/HupF
MCLTVPCRVVSVDEPISVVVRGEHRLPVSCATLDSMPQVGDWVAVQAQRYAVAVMSEADARLALDLLNQLAESEP